MNGKQVVVSKLIVFLFKFDEFYGLFADHFHLEGGTLLFPMPTSDTQQCADIGKTIVWDIRATAFRECCPLSLKG